MGIWIRSQNKEVLRHCSKMQYFKMQYFKTKSSHLVVDVNTGVDNVTILGEYPTRERAIEVLDEINKEICRDAQFHYYQMPVE